MHVRSRLFSLLIAAARFARAHGFGQTVDGALDRIDRVYLSIDRPPLGIDHDGLSLRGYLRHRSFLASLEQGARDLYTQKLFKSSLRAGMTVIDGGAHLGLYTLIAARGVSREGVVMAFEPDPYNVRALEFNVLNNGFRNVMVFEKALGTSVDNAASIGALEQLAALFFRGLHSARCIVCPL